MPNTQEDKINVIELKESTILELQNRLLIVLVERKKLMRKWEEHQTEERKPSGSGRPQQVVQDAVELFEEDSCE